MLNARLLFGFSFQPQGGDRDFRDLSDVGESKYDSRDPSSRMVVRVRSRRRYVCFFTYKRSRR